MVVNIVNVSKRRKQEKGDEKDTSHQGLESLVLLVKSKKTVCVCRNWWSAVDELWWWWWWSPPPFAQIGVTNRQLHRIFILVKSVRLEVSSCARSFIKSKKWEKSRNKKERGSSNTYSTFHYHHHFCLIAACHCKWCSDLAKHLCFLLCAHCVDRLAPRLHYLPDYLPWKLWTRLR